MTDHVPPSDEVTAHARGEDGTCGDATCPACRFADVYKDLREKPAEVRYAFGHLLLEIGAALIIEAGAELAGGG
ncbi:MAG: hypothetical protein AB7O78_01565 [Thermoleophilia bacterium]